MDKRQQYSVALVYQAQKGDRLETALRSSITVSRSEHEALGVVIGAMKEDKALDGLSLLLSCVVEVPTNTTEA